MEFWKRLFGSSKSDTATPVCGRCGNAVITNAERLQGIQRIAKKYGATVDENGRVALPSRITSLTGPLTEAAKYMQASEERKQELQRKLNENASRCGFRCTQCGNIYCTTCLGKEARTHPVLGGKACFACGGNVRAIDDPTIQAEYYIVSYLPPGPSPVDREGVILRILATNGYTKGTAGVYFAVSASGPEALEAFTMGLMFNYQQESGKEIDNGRTKIHKFGKDAVQGRVIAIIHTGQPYVRKAAR